MTWGLLVMLNRKNRKNKNLGLKKSYIISDTIAELQKKLHLTSTQINNMFPDLIEALKQENIDNMQRNCLIVKAKAIKRFEY